MNAASNGHKEDWKLGVGTALLSGAIFTGAVTVLQAVVQKENEKRQAAEKRADLARDCILRIGVSGDLRGFTNPPGCNLEGAHFDGKLLDHARLERAHLEGATFIGTSLQGANLKDAHLEGADLREANLSGAVISGAFLDKASLEYSKMPNAQVDDPAFGHLPTPVPTIRVNAETCWSYKGPLPEQVWSHLKAVPLPKDNGITVDPGRTKDVRFGHKRQDNEVAEFKAAPSKGHGKDKRFAPPFESDSSAYKPRS